MIIGEELIFSFPSGALKSRISLILSHAYYKTMDKSNSSDIVQGIKTKKYFVFVLSL